MLQAGKVQRRGVGIPPAVDTPLPGGQFKMGHGDTHIEMLQPDLSQGPVVKPVLFQVKAVAAVPVFDYPPGLAVRR
jgi:hypothetical protein